MSLEHSPSHQVGGAGGEGDAGPKAPPAADLDYWNALIDERAGAEFYGVTDRTMQVMRQRGGGPRYIVLSSRCIRYTRRWLQEHALTRARSSTSDLGPGTEAA